MSNKSEFLRPQPSIEQANPGVEPEAVKAEDLPEDFPSELYAEAQATMRSLGLSTLLKEDFLAAVKAGFAKAIKEEYSSGEEIGEAELFLIAKDVCKIVAAQFAKGKDYNVN